MSSTLIKGIQVAASVGRVLLLVGDRQYDRFVLQLDSKPQILDLEALLQVSFPQSPKLVRYDPVGTSVPQQSQSAEHSLQKHLSELEPEQILLVDGQLLFEDPGLPRDRDHKLLRDIEHFARVRKDRGLLCVRTQQLRALPQALSISPFVRKINIPPASRDERKAYALLRGCALAEACQIDLEDVATLLSGLTDSWQLEEMENLIRVCAQQRVDSRTGIEAAVRAIALGVSDSPWSGQVLKTMIKAAPERLGQRVRGQPAALSLVCSALRKAATGLGGAYQGSFSRGPRAVLFFAGPTGTGKTEMAKALAELVFGDETAISRYDCAEFRQDHAVARLIGAPPGYVGFETGGELTERVRNRPHSVLLFDEIEKAHPRMLDLFLSILDDGRLTDGQGVTTYFDETILIFTSNLGIYRDQNDLDGRERRVPRFTLETQIQEITITVREAIKEEFVSVLGRPELLGRLGGENALIVFDFIRDIEGVANKFIDRIAERLLTLHGIKLAVNPEVVDMLVARASTHDSLVLGARGLGQIIDSELSSPIADLLTVSSIRPDHLSIVLDDNKVTVLAE